MATIRPYKTEDAGPLVDLVLELHESLRPFDLDLAPGKRIIDAHFRDLLDKVQQTSGALFVAEDENQMIGYVCLWGAVPPEDVDERPESYGFMAELYVRPGHRNLGIGRLLVAQAERRARECGSYKVELKVLAGNEAAVRFYQKLGYTPRLIVMSKRV